MSTPHERPAPTATDLESMTPDEIARLAAEMDDVEVVHNTRKFPVPGTRAEKRAERSVALWFILSAVSGLAFVFAFIGWPYEYVSPLDDSTTTFLGIELQRYTLFALYTPVAGLTFGLAVLALGVGVIAYVKRFFPDEVSVQQRHDGPSDEVARTAVMAQLGKAGRDTDIGRRSLIKRAAGGAAGVLGLVLGVGALAPFIRNPWAKGDESPLWVTGWAPKNGETVYLRRDTGVLGEIVRVRPEDMEAGAIETVFPFRLSEEGDEEALLHAQRASDAAVMLIRLRPGTPVTQRQGQEDFHYGDFYAYSKVCSHLGCPTSLYEAQTNRILCPCHQSQFIANEYAKPIFGPATRALAQLPITVNDEGYFVARSDFVEPVGPAFWERRS